MKKQFLNQLINFFIKHWIRKDYKKDEKIDDIEAIFYILEWNLKLINNNTIIARIYEWSIFWEKSFFEWTKRPLDWIWETNWSCLIINKEIYENLSDKEKIEFLNLINLYNWERLYLINEILILIKNIFNNINDIEKIFSFLWNIKYYFILNKDLGLVKSNTLLKEEELEFLEKNLNHELIFWKNYIIFKTKNYIFFLIWEIKEQYIISNLINYTLGIFEYIWNKLEEKKWENIKNIIK